MKRAAAILLLALPLIAQHRDFLTTDEVEQIREAQEPNARVTLYAKFALDRVEMVKNLASKPKAGRATMIHDALEDYAHILDAVDEVTDEALAHGADLKLGLSAITKTERQALPILKKLQENPPNDVDRYEFALRTAVETTTDSLELAEEDMGKRAKDVEAREAREKKAAEETMAPVGGEVKKAEDKQAPDAEAPKPQRKAPTLMRPGEKTDDSKKK